MGLLIQATQQKMQLLRTGFNSKRGTINLIFAKYFFCISAIFLAGYAHADSSNSPCDGIVVNGKYTKQFISVNNIVSLSIASYDSTPTRGEFEKKEDYLKRVNIAKNSLNEKVTSETKNGKFFYKKNFPSYDVSYDIDNERINISGLYISEIHSTKPKKKFNTLDVASDTKSEDSVNMRYKEGQPIKLQNRSYYSIGFITKNKNLNGSKTNIQFKINPEEAKASKDNISLIIVGSPISPYIARDSDAGMSEGLVFSSNSTAALIKLECAVIINNRTGKLVHQLI